MLCLSCSSGLFTAGLGRVVGPLSLCVCVQRPEIAEIFDRVAGNKYQMSLDTLKHFLIDEQKVCMGIVRDRILSAEKLILSGFLWCRWSE